MEQKVVVTERAFLARMKRNLASTQGLSLKAARYGTRAYQDLGPFYSVDSNNVVDHKNVDFETLEKWAREDGTLKPYEVVERTAA